MYFPREKGNLPRKNDALYGHRIQLDTCWVNKSDKNSKIPSYFLPKKIKINSETGS